MEFIAASHYFVIFRGLPDEERIVRVARCANEEIELELGLGFLGWYSDVHRGVSQLQDIQLVSGELKNIRHCFLSSSFFVCVARCADKEIELELDCGGPGTSIVTSTAAFHHSRIFSSWVLHSG